MKKMIAALALLGPLLLTACADKGETVVVQPPPPQSGAIVIPERDDSNTVVVPQSGGGVKVCPEGTVC